MEDMNFEVALIRCFFCGKDKGLVLNAQLTPEAAKAVKECNGKAIDLEPCNNCKKLMKQGVMLFEIEAVPDDPSQLPERTGRLAVVKDSAFDNFPDEDFKNQVIKRRFGFIQKEYWEQMGLGGNR